MRQWQKKYFYLLLSILYFFSYTSEAIAQSQAHALNALPDLYNGVRLKGELSPVLKHPQADARHLPHIKVTENKYASEPLPETRSQSGFVRLSSSYTLNIDADSLHPVKGTACVTEALDSGQRKKWQCFNEQGHHSGVTIDLDVSRNDKFEVSLPVIQDITVQYLTLSGGETNPLFKFRQPDIAKEALKQSLKKKEKINKTVQKVSAIFKIFIRRNMDDPGIKAIKFKLTNGISQEDEQVFQDRIKNIMLNDKPEILKNTDDIPLLPGTTLRLSAHGLQFAGKIINLAGGKDGGAKSDQKNTKQNKNSSGNQPSTSSEATSTSTSSNPAEYTFEYSENCPYCQNQKSEKKVDTDSRFNQRPLLNRALQG